MEQQGTSTVDVSLAYPGEVVLRRSSKLTKQSVGAGSTLAERSLRSLERRVRGSLGGRTATGRRRSAGLASMPRARRKVTDSELLERRRQALATAREAR